MMANICCCVGLQMPVRQPMQQHTFFVTNASLFAFGVTMYIYAVIRAFISLLLIIKTYNPHKRTLDGLRRFFAFRQKKIS